MARALVPGRLQEVHQPERLTQIARAEAEVLVVLDAGLAVQVDVEQLARPQRLRDAVREVETGHLLVARLRVHADQFGALQALDEGQGVPDGGQQDVAARLVRLGLDGEAQVVALLGDVLAEQVEGLLHPVERDLDVLRRAGLGALPAAPGHVHGGAELDGEVDVAEGLAQGEAAYVPVVGGERAVLEDRVGEEVRSGHRHREPGAVQGGPEALDDRVALGVRGAEGDQVVVVEGDAVRAEVGEPLDGLDGVERRAGRLAERVAALPADGPEAEGEAVLGGGGEELRHGVSFSCSRDLFSEITNTGRTRGAPAPATDRPPGRPTVTHYREEVRTCPRAAPS